MIRARPDGRRGEDADLDQACDATTIGALTAALRLVVGGVSGLTRVPRLLVMRRARQWPSMPTPSPSCIASGLDVFGDAHNVADIPAQFGAGFLIDLRRPREQRGSPWCRP